jgi:hypothetical protein
MILRLLSSTSSTGQHIVESIDVHDDTSDDADWIDDQDDDDWSCDSDNLQVCFFVGVTREEESTAAAAVAAAGARVVTDFEEPRRGIAGAVVATRRPTPADHSSTW